MLLRLKLVLVGATCLALVALGAYVGYRFSQARLAEARHIQLREAEELTRRGVLAALPSSYEFMKSEERHFGGVEEAKKVAPSLAPTTSVHAATPVAKAADCLIPPGSEYALQADLLLEQTDHQTVAVLGSQSLVVNGVPVFTEPISPQESRAFVLDREHEAARDKQWFAAAVGSMSSTGPAYGALLGRSFGSVGAVELGWLVGATTSYRVGPDATATAVGGLTVRW